MKALAQQPQISQHVTCCPSATTPTDSAKNRSSSRKADSMASGVADLARGTPFREGIPARQGTDCSTPVVYGSGSDPSGGVAAAGRFVLTRCLPKWPRRGLQAAGASEQQAACMVRADPSQDETNGFFVAVLERERAGKAVRQEEIDVTEMGARSTTETGDGVVGAKKRRNRHKNRRKKRKKGDGGRLESALTTASELDERRGQEVEGRGPVEDRRSRGGGSIDETSASTRDESEAASDEENER